MTTARVLVLGSCGAWPEPGRACSGFVVEHAGFRVVLDLGFGTLPRLLAHLGSVVGDGVDAVVVTHAHADHAVDLGGLFRARRFGARDRPPVPVYAAPGVEELVAAVEADDAAAVREAFTWHRLPGTHAVGPFRLDGVELPHFVPNVGVRLTSPEVTIAYTGDTGPSPALAELGRGADLFIVEASDRDQQPTTPRASASGLHLSSTEAGEAALAAGARRLLLTHFWPGNDRLTSGRRARAVYGGDVLIAEEGLTVDV